MGFPSSKHFRKFLQKFGEKDVYANKDITNQM